MDPEGSDWRDSEFDKMRKTLELSPKQFGKVMVSFGVRLQPGELSEIVRMFVVRIQSDSKST